jgi:CheY-like chemotaxis protein
MASKKEFCIPTLLNMNTLDIRRVAADNEGIPAHLYLAHLERLLESTPAFLEKLGRLIDRKRDKSLLHSFRKLKDALANIGDKCLAEDIEYICTGIMRREVDLAADRAAVTYGKLAELHRELDNAYMSVTAGTKTTPDSKTQTLGELIKRTEEKEATRKRRILAVDDATPMLKILTMELGSQYEVYALTRGILVDNFLKHTTPDLFLLDIIMPDLSGFDLIPIIRNFDKHKHTPIIFISSDSSEETMLKAKEMGVCEYIVKPVDMVTLRKTIAQYIVKRRDDRE